MPDSLSKQDLYTELVNYVRHCQHVANGSKSEYYHNTMFLLAMEIVDFEMRWVNACYHERPMLWLARVVVGMEEHLMAILPHKDNASYTKQFENIDTLIGGCRKFIVQNLNPDKKYETVFAKRY